MPMTENPRITMTDADRANHQPWGKSYGKWGEWAQVTVTLDVFCEFDEGQKGMHDCAPEDRLDEVAPSVDVVGIYTEDGDDASGVFDREKIGELVCKEEFGDA